MNNKFMVGDLVICKVGGPVMIVATVPIQQNGGAFIAGNHAFGGVGGAWPVVQAPINSQTYTCTWWNSGLQTFAAWTFHEDMLEDAPTNN